MTTIDLDLIDIEPIKILHACHADWITDCKWSNIGDFLVSIKYIQLTIYLTTFLIFAFSHYEKITEI